MKRMIYNDLRRAIESMEIAADCGSLTEAEAEKMDEVRYMVEQAKKTVEMMIL